jgi:hypothetical protein
MLTPLVEGKMPDHYCQDCGYPEYECCCSEGLCDTCGCELDEEAINAGRTQCFACYCESQD